MKDVDIYRNQIIEMVGKIENVDILDYISIIISDIIIEEGENRQWRVKIKKEIKNTAKMHD